MVAIMKVFSWINFAIKSKQVENVWVRCSVVIFSLVLSLFLNVNPLNVLEIKPWNPIKEMNNKLICSLRDEVWQPSTALWVINQCYWHVSANDTNQVKAVRSADALTQSQIPHVMQRCKAETLIQSAYTHTHTHTRRLHWNTITSRNASATKGHLIWWGLRTHTHTHTYDLRKASHVD